MTVVTQQYTLHCVTVGFDSYTITLYGNDQQIYSGGCGNGNCIKQLLHSSNNTYDNTVNITWDAETISSGSYSQSVNGDQMYRCNVIRNDANRNRYLTVKGIKLFHTHLQYIYFKFQDLFLLLLKSTRRVLLSLSVGQLIQLMLMDM